MIKERYCSKEVSELLREKGFDEYCIAVYNGNATVTAFELYGEFSVKNSECDDEDVVTAPTNQMAMDFLQKKKNAFIYVEPFITTCDGKQKFNGYKPYVCVLNKTESWVNPLREYSNTYTESFEKAVEEALKYTLKKLI